MNKSALGQRQLLSETKALLRLNQSLVGEICVLQPGVRLWMRRGPDFTNGRTIASNQTRMLVLSVRHIRRCGINPWTEIDVTVLLEGKIWQSVVGDIKLENLIRRVLADDDEKYSYR